MRRDIDEAMQGWPYEPEPGEVVVARQLKARDGRPILQIRVELGVLQMEDDGRPDGVRPHGFNTYLDYLRHKAATRGSGGKAGRFSMSTEQRAETDREFSQFNQRRVAWLSLQRYEKARQDADHSLALLDFVKSYGQDPDYIATHERFRGLVLFHKAQAAAALALERGKPDESIDAVREGMDRLVEHQESWNADPDREGLPTEALVEQLRSIEGEIRKKFAVSKTLREQLDDAVAEEDYERAARLRDQIKARAGR